MIINTVVKAMKYIDENIQNEIALEQVAEKCNYSLSHMQNIFFKVTGKSLAYFIRVKKLEHSAKRLVFSKEKIIDIALQSGYGSNEAFTRIFKEKYKQTPREFRNDDLNKELFKRLGKDRSQNLLKLVKETSNNIIKPKTSKMMCNIDNVYQVGFYPGSNFTPEDFPFISCLSSAMTGLGEEYPIKSINAHNQEWKQRMGNIYFLGWSGIGFGFVWDQGWDDSVCDFMLCDKQDTIIENAFNAAGREYLIITRTDYTEDEFKDIIKKSIDIGHPVIATGVIGPPESCIITGYTDDCNTLIGWSFFQLDENYADDSFMILPSGQFIKSNWFKDTYSVIIIGNKKQVPEIHKLDKLTLETAVRLAETYDINSLVTGHEAYVSWSKQVLCDKGITDVEVAQLKKNFDVHNITVGNIAEARAYAGSYLFDMAESRYSDTEEGKYIVKAAENYDDIHSLMWEAWNVLGGNGNPDAYIMFSNLKNREKIAGIINKAKEKDIKAIKYIKRALNCLQQIKHKL